MSDARITRSFPLDDIRVRSGGDGRTVEAYAAVFENPTEIRDQDGHYLEELDRGVFNKTLRERASKVGVFYNHGMTLSGTPSDRGSLPIGIPLEIKPDKKGLWTLTRYANTPLADEVLEMIRAGAITGQSFSGRPIQNRPKIPRFGYMPREDGSLVTVRRMEIALLEYGPTPRPAYEAAEILSLRSAEGVIKILDGMPPEERQRLAELLASSTPVDLTEVSAEIEEPEGDAAPDEETEGVGIDESVPEEENRSTSEPDDLRRRIQAAATDRKGYLLDILKGM